MLFAINYHQPADDIVGNHYGKVSKDIRQMPCSCGFQGCRKFATFSNDRRPRIVDDMHHIGHIGGMHLPADAQLHVIGELLTELIQLGQRQEALMRRVVLLLGEQGRQGRGGVAGRKGTIQEYLLDMAASDRQARANRYAVPFVRWLASKGGRASKTEAHRRFNIRRVWMAVEQLERDGYVRLERVGRHTIVALTDLANEFMAPEAEPFVPKSRSPRIRK